MKNEIRLHDGELNVMELYGQTKNWLPEIFLKS